MKILQGSEKFTDTERIAEVGLYVMIPLLQYEERRAIAGTHMLAPDFRVNPEYFSVTRDPEDTIVHDHERHVLLMRSGPTVPDDTLICDRIEGWRALAYAIVETDLEHTLRNAMPADDPDEDNLLESLVHGCNLVCAGEDEEVPTLLRNGVGAMRYTLREHPGLLSADVRVALYQTLVIAQRYIPEGKFEVVRWDDEQRVDAVMIGAQTGHARSLLHVDPVAATPAELDAALGTAGDGKSRGLHFGSFDAE